MGRGPQTEQDSSRLQELSRRLGAGTGRGTRRLQDMQDGRLRPSGPTMQVVLTSRTPELDASLPEREPPCSRPCICPCTFQETRAQAYLNSPSWCSRLGASGLQVPSCSYHCPARVCFSPSAYPRCTQSRSTLRHCSCTGQQLLPHTSRHTHNTRSATDHRPPRLAQIVRSRL